MCHNAQYDAWVTKLQCIKIIIWGELVKLTLFPKLYQSQIHLSSRNMYRLLLQKHRNLPHWKTKPCPIFLEPQKSESLLNFMPFLFPLPPSLSHKVCKMPLFTLLNLENKNKTKSLCFFQYFRHLGLCLLNPEICPYKLQKSPFLSPKFLPPLFTCSSWVSMTGSTYSPWRVTWNYISEVLKHSQNSS